jgi:hypothetical protein
VIAPRMIWNTKCLNPSRAIRSTCMPKLALRQRFTSYDRTCYICTATGMTDENLDILLNMVGHPWFTKETIA